jgi:hypothetical protein
MDSPPLISSPANQTRVTEFVEAKHVQVGEGGDSPSPPQLAKSYVVCVLGLSCHEAPIINSCTK